MKLIYHYTGEWVRSNCDTSATRTNGYITEYSSIDTIEDEWIKENFNWMINTGEIVISTGSHVFQIRGE